MTALLPIHAVLPDVRAALARHSLVVLQAPPGAGKSTVLPTELLGEPWLAGQGVVVLQPRRVAARSVAARLASNTGSEVGGLVGYRVRFDSRVSARTRVTVMTEGILTRLLQSDPELPGVGLVVFDEFHERSLQADLALALVREVQDALRPDLRVLVMSATLDPALPARLGNVPLVASEGRAYPVDVKYLPVDPAGPPDAAVTAAVTRALSDLPGDVLAFLPGVGEIRRALGTLSARHPDVTVLPLYGDLSPEAQGRAILPDPDGRRKVVLATSIAETSLTLDGVRVVIDSGWTRRQQFDPGTGLSRLVTVRVTHDAATQRAGRAGRTAPGVALRLWSERTQAALAAAQPPEILEADLAPLTLELAGWGTPDPGSLHWLDAPPERRVESARVLLRDLDALTPQGLATPEGLALLRLPTHPRLAHLLRGSVQAGLQALACDVAALLEERDPLAGTGAGTDLGERLLALHRWRNRQATTGDTVVLERVERLSRHWRQEIGMNAPHRHADPADVGRLVALAYPERVAALREGTRDRYLMVGGQGVRLPEADPLAGTPLIAVATLDARQVAGEGRVYLAAPIHEEALAARVTREDRVRWDARTGTLIAQREDRVGAVLLHAEPLRDVPAHLRTAALTDAVRQEGLEVLRWSDTAQQWLARVSSLRAWRGDDWPDLGRDALLARLDEWLPGTLGTARTRDDLNRVDVLPALQTLLPWNLTRTLDELAPVMLDVPSGNRVRLQYRADGEAPILAVKLQELFGLADTPTVNAGRTPVLLHLLSPARRPVQVTQDLRSFWERGYFEARKDLRGQYPRHPWPDDPWTAEATRKAKPRGT
ncbi:ATP-dependent helicase HrpB [Deinococcus aquiradiocola]|uniref:ATP-dependent helicase HrpB n=1 Tax=Deinococcus aquiradiocola TaxID=393059 RepID=A0A917UIZ7_9DEIO|nr:ATP-dependent helicase HrpB [Deinococcus aquiradiocola]GGJ61441.1 ATP-dependent helicase HrpB [Deinococcus aquiradiocola]